MSFAGAIAIILLSLMLTFIFVFGLKTKGPWGSVWSFFIIVFLSLSTVSLWVPPAGPVWLGAAWIDLLITGLLVSFFMSAVTPLKYHSHSSAKSEVFSNNDDVYKQHNEQDRVGTQNSEDRDIVKLGSVFWMLLAVLSVLTVIGAV